MHALLTAFLGLYLSHLLTDFVLQSDRMIADKRRSSAWAYAGHGAVHFFSAALFLGFAIPGLALRWSFYAYILGLVLVHLIIDWLKIRLVRSETLADGAPAFLGDQAIHALTVFLTAWLIFVYFPFVHMVWSPDGLFARMGVLDFAGGIVVHTTAGFAALASVIFVGRRCDSTDAPHNVPLMALGAGLLWFGWFGFNAGSEVGVDWVTVSSFVNTQLGAAFAGCTWLVLEWANVRRPNFVGLMTGAVAGLAAITPAAGYVSFGIASVIGFSAGLVCYYAVTIKKVFGWDDALDVWGVHGVGGVLGAILLGVFAAKSWNPHGAAGLLSGGTRFFLWQCIAVVASAAWAFAFSYAALWLINCVTLVRVDAETENLGLDAGLLGEAAYSEDR